MDPASENTASVTFGRFRVLPHRRELLADGRPIKLGGRAFDVLMALVEAPGAVVDKDALMQRVWPDRIVEENALQAQISALRAAFAAERDLIRTVPGRGYQFTGEIRIPSAQPDKHADPGPATVEPKLALPPTNLPEAVSDLIGRDDELRELLSFAAAHRFVTMTGAGGIGKTRLARAAARRLLPRFADGVWVAELAALADADLIPGVVASVVGLELPGGPVSADRVAAALGGKELLLVLDNCEHVVGAAAIMAEALLRANPAAQVIATSREPLKAEGEWVYSVPPLAVPTGNGKDNGDFLRYGAVRLFFERARAATPHFAPDQRLASVVAAICRRLDGIPLAIELAAARAATLGIEELAAGLDDRFRLLTGGRRTALPRHQTLRATLDWSYGLLAESECVILRRLAVFAGAFSLEAASAVVASPEIARAEIVDGLSDLAAKSLITVEVDTTVGRYRLLETTRAYALEKLGESGELNLIARRHAEYYRALFERAETEFEKQPTAEWLADCGRKIDNLRAALDWAFSPDGDASVGVALTAAAVPLWMHLSLAEECLSRAERALAALAAGADGDARREMKLQAALAASLMYARGLVPELGVIWARIFEIAERLGDTKYQLRSLWGRWAFHVSGNEHQVALQLAQRFCALAAKQPDQTEELVGERMMGVSQFWLGDLPAARRHLERVLARHAAPHYRSYIIRYQTDPHVTARAVLARILWLQGFPEQALRTAEGAVEDAGAINHEVSLCYALAHGGCSIALWIGDLDRAERYVTMLLDHSASHALPYWGALGRIHQAVLVMRRGDIDRGLRLLRIVLDDLSAMSAMNYLMFLSNLAEAFGRAGQIADGLATTERAIQRSENIEERWVIAELLRVKGELVLLQGGSGAAAEAETHFRQALDWARRQGALSWELRTATSLARLTQSQGRSADAIALLQPVYDQFTEGFDTADLKAAKKLIDALGERGVGPSR